MWPFWYFGNNALTFGGRNGERTGEWVLWPSQFTYYRHSGMAPTFREREP